MHSREAKPLAAAPQSGHLEAAAAAKGTDCSRGLARQLKARWEPGIPAFIYSRLPPSSHPLSSAAWCASHPRRVCLTYCAPLKAEGTEINHCLKPTVTLDDSKETVPQRGQLSLYPSCEAEPWGRSDHLGGPRQIPTREDFFGPPCRTGLRH